MTRSVRQQLILKISLNIFFNFFHYVAQFNWIFLSFSWLFVLINIYCQTESLINDVTNQVVFAELLSEKLPCNLFMMSTRALNIISLKNLSSLINELYCQRKIVKLLYSNQHNMHNLRFVTRRSNTQLLRHQDTSQCK